jgi:type I restriction enzyme S subunit
MSAATLHTKTKKMLVPTLRFKEFEEPWIPSKLGDVTKYIKGYAFKSEDYQDNGIRIVRVSDLAADRIKTDNDKIYIDEQKASEFDKYKLRTGNIVITTVGSKPEMLESAVGRGIFIHNDNEGLLNQNMLKFENIKGISNGFIIGLINSRRYQHYMKGIARGNANQANITVVDLLQYKISYPTLPEQQKIASFLSAVDEKIQQLTKKKTLLEQYKKGVMQQLFSGKLHFKDENGKSYPDWVPRKMSEVLFEHKLNSTGKEEVFSVSVHKGLINQVEHLGRVFAAKNTDNYNLVQPGDIVYTKSPTGSFPLGIIKQSKIDQNVIVSPLYGIFTPETPGLGYMFNVYFESPINTQNYLASIIQKGAKNTINITNTTFLSKKMKLPTSKEEQNKIGNFLKELDTKIERINQQITQTQTFKKGLLQKMFV